MNEDLVSPSVAVDRLLDCRQSVMEAIETEVVAPDAIAGRTAAERVVAPRDTPAVDFATMDGFALAAEDDYPLAVVGSVAPADEPPSVAPGEAVRIATGAPLPERADAVLPREDATLIDGELSGPPLTAGTNRYPSGTTATEGERLFDQGETLSPRHAALLRDVGVERVVVRRRPSVGVLATGTEIHEGHQPDRDSEMLVNLVRAWGGDPTLLGSVPDDEAAVRNAIERAADDHDAVLTSGGTSVGPDDHVGRTLTDHDPLFAGVALRPGRPVTVATVDGTPVCGLPGKPVAAHVAATLVLRPFFTGRVRRPTVRAEPNARVDLPDADYEYAVPVALADGSATPVGHGDSSLPLYGTQFAPGRVASCTRVALADGVVVTADSLVPDTPVDVVPYEVVEP